MDSYVAPRNLDKLSRAHADLGLAAYFRIASAVGWQGWLAGCLVARLVDSQLPECLAVA